MDRSWRGGPRASDPRAIDRDATVATPAFCGLVFALAFLTAFRTVAPQAFAFAVASRSHGRTASVTAVRGGPTRRFPYGLVTSRPIAEILGVLLCCVTTRRPGGVAPGTLAR